MFNLTHLHPMVVHFPIALILVGFLADVLFLFFKKEVCLSKTGFYLMIIGTVAAATAFTTGHLFTDEPTEGDIMKFFILHKQAALITLIIMGAGSLTRIYMVVKHLEKTMLRWVVFVLYFLGAASVGFTGFMGGEMVYTYMIGL